MTREYCWNTKKSNGHEPCDILLQHFKSDDFRTIVIRADELAPWKICDALNDAFNAGREDARREIRNVLGVKK